MACLFFSILATLFVAMIIPVAVGDEEMRNLRKKGVVK